jgi:glycosyltransferase involved in cell wall biosynthesis
MASLPDIQKIAFIGDYLPRLCGIATFTHDLLHAVTSRYPKTECEVVAVNDQAEGYEYPPEVRFEIAEQELDGYHRAADFLNFSNVDLVCLQHEFGIFGGTAGAHIVALLKDLRMPVVTTLHTVLREPNHDQRRVMQQLAQLSARIVVMSARGQAILRDIYSISEDKIDVIPHGIPDMPFVDPNFFKDQFNVEGKNVLLTFGLLSPNKGIEYVLQALPQVLRDFPDTVYIVLGATHPDLVREHGENYRLSLERMTRDLGIKKNVAFYNRFVELHELTEFIGAADIYITPYLNPAQITSGTLAYAFGCGTAVISTPYWHAEELLAEDRGALVPFGDSAAIAKEIGALLRDETRRHAMRKRAYLLGREMIWSNVGYLYMSAFQRARRSSAQTARRPPVIRTLDERPLELPRVRLEHLLRMTDSTGIFQHATNTIPNFREGFCTDDNARALVASVMLEELGLDGPEVQRASAAYAGFLEYAHIPETGRFRNFLNFDRRWAEEAGSDDSLGRAIWALGTCVGRSRQTGLQFWAVRLFEGALSAVLEAGSLRAWAFALLGVHEYLRRLSGDRFANQVREVLTDRLIAAFHATSAPDWPWFENLVSYDNAKIPHALILSGRWSDHHEALDIGLRSLRWLCQVQHTPKNFFRPIGSNGFFPRGESPAELDQQPIEAHAMVSACIEAFRATDDDFWLDEARFAFEWFMGRNHLGIPLYSSATGGCYDGLHADRVNQNQGAESNLAFLLSLIDMRLLDASLATFDKPSSGEPNPPRALSPAAPTSDPHRRQPA